MFFELLLREKEFYMKKSIFVMIIAVIICLSGLLNACKGDYAPEFGDSGGNIISEIEEELSGAEELPDATERKIIYTINTRMIADNMEEAIATIKSSLEEGEWMDYESVGESYARFTARVKSDRIDAYIASISEDNEVEDYEKTATDISLNYADKEATVDALEAERARLVILIDDATIAEIIQINTRISEIDLEITRLQGLLNEYDSLIDYSEINIKLYAADSPEAKLPFGEKLNGIFISAWEALGAFFQGIVIAVTAMFPFLITLGPIVVGIFFLVRYLKKRKGKALTAKAKPGNPASPKTEDKTTDDKNNPAS
jgi:hypothetical protein